jgi:hypothetical protein
MLHGLPHSPPPRAQVYERPSARDTQMYRWSLRSVPPAKNQCGPARYRDSVFALDSTAPGRRAIAHESTVVMV